MTNHRNPHHQNPSDSCQRLSLPIMSTSLILFVMMICQASTNMASALIPTLITTTTPLHQYHQRRSLPMTPPPFPHANQSRQQQSQSIRLFLTPKESANDAEEEMSFGDSAVVIPDLDWRVQKLRLEEENKKRFLKAKPRFLPYKDAMMWVQAWGQRWETQEDW